MPALEPVEAWRAVATPAALDGARWEGDAVDVLRLAPDEAVGIGATGVSVDADANAIVEPEAGFSVAVLGPEFVLLGAHTDWPIPETPGSVLQGKIAGVPAKLRIGDPTLLVVQTAYVDELRRRLGW